ncbi:MAG: hypothetical protein QXN55_00910 [Candidatus Nitrosotenuis sp.]
MAEKKRAFKLDIFWLLGQINQRVFNIWTNLDTEQRKSIAPIVIQRWLAGTHDSLAIQKLNDHVNPYVFALGKYPELLLKLMATTGNRSGGRYFWKPLTKKKNQRLALQAIAEARSCSIREAKAVFSAYTADDIIELAEDLAWEKDQLTKLKKELKDG